MDKQCRKVLSVGHDVLELIRAHVDKDAIIAGGLPRDLWLELPIKDVDIFTTAQLTVAALQLLLPEAKEIKLYVLSKEDLNIQCIKFKLQGVHIDVITINKDKAPTGSAYVETFDFNICQAWMESRHVLNVTTAFLHDAENCTLTFNPTERNKGILARILKTHLPRLINKFPNHTVMGITGKKTVPLVKRLQKMFRVPGRVDNMRGAPSMVVEGEDRAQQKAPRGNLP